MAVSSQIINFEELFVISETPIGAVDCNNVSYETAFEFLSHSLEIFVDGVRQDENDFTITSAKSFDLNISPLSETENLRVNYIKAC